MYPFYRKTDDFKITHQNVQKTKSTYSPPNDAATTTEPATEPAAVAAAAKPVAPITGMTAPSVGARAPSPAAIAGAANPVE